MRHLAALILLLSLTACNSSMLGRYATGPDDRRAALPASVDMLNKALSWNSMEDALPIIDRSYILDFKKGMRKFQSGKITDVTLESHEFDNNADTAAVTSTIKYYSAPLYVIKTVEYRQNWKYKPDVGGWLLVSGEFKSPEPEKLSDVVSDL